MRTLEGENRLRNGLMGIIVLVLVVGVGQSLASVPMLFATPTYYAQFTDTAGLATGDKVRVAGVDVGEIRSLEINGDKVVIGYSLTGARLVLHPRGRRRGARAVRARRSRSPARRRRVVERQGQAARQEPGRQSAPHDQVAQGSKITFDDDKNQLIIEDGTGKGRITIDTDKNKIMIEALEGDVCFQSPTGDMKIVAKSVELKAGQNIEIHAGSTMAWGTDASVKINGRAASRCRARR